MSVRGPLPLDCEKLTSSSTDFCRFSCSLTSRFRFRDRASCLNFPATLGFRDIVEEGIVEFDCSAGEAAELIF